MTLRDFLADFYEEIGRDLAELVEDPEVIRWLNTGLRKIEWKLQSDGALTWSAGDRTVAFPADYFGFVSLIPDDGVTIPPYLLWNNSLRFTDPEGASEGGSATLLYYGTHPTITGSQDSLLPHAGNEALHHYLLHRFFKKLSTSRSDFRTYATTAGSNGVDIEELAALADRHLDDFETAQDNLPPREPSTFFSE